jgi:hypothetical protein
MYVVKTGVELLWERKDDDDDDDDDTDDADCVDDDDEISNALLRPPAQCTTNLT